MREARSADEVATTAHARTDVPDGAIPALRCIVIEGPDAGLSFVLEPGAPARGRPAPQPDTVRPHDRGEHRDASPLPALRAARSRARARPHRGRDRDGQGSPRRVDPRGRRHRGAVEDDEGAATAGGRGGAGGSPPDPKIVGCSDGTREGFHEIAVYPDIAACSGGFMVLGVRSPATDQPQCNRSAGNDGALPNGDGGAGPCSVADLCAEGWSVCESAADVVKHFPGCPDPPIAGMYCCPNDVAESRYFFLTRQRFNNANCDTQTGVNNLLGCGKMVGELPNVNDDYCQPLDMKVRDSQCELDPDWDCGTEPANDNNESEVVTKHSPAAGGVLCCRDLF